MFRGHGLPRAAEPLHLPRVLTGYVSVLLLCFLILSVSRFSATPVSLNVRGCSHFARLGVFEPKLFISGSVKTYNNFTALTATHKKILSFALRESTSTQWLITLLRTVFTCHV